MLIITIFCIDELLPEVEIVVVGASGEAKLYGRYIFVM
jgi:hypothetical protein